MVSVRKNYHFKKRCPQKISGYGSGYFSIYSPPFSVMFPWLKNLLDLSFYKNQTRTVTRNGFLGAFIYKNIHWVIYKFAEEISEGPGVKKYKCFLQEKVALIFSLLQVFISINLWLSNSKYASDRHTYNIWKIYVKAMYNSRYVQWQNTFISITGIIATVYWQMNFKSLF